MRTKGFTLIELLVVIAIIGVLSSVVLVSLNTARQKSRDSVRVQAIRQISTALELYALDHGGNYPIGTGYNPALMPPTWRSYESRVTSEWTAFETILRPYISKLNKDPNDGASDGMMCSNCAELLYSSDGKKYVVSTYLSQTGPSQTGSNIYGPYAQIMGGLCTGPSNFWSCQ